MSSLYDIIKRISVEANEAEKNDKMVTGKVTACTRKNPNYDPDKPAGPDNQLAIIEPLVVQLSDKIILKDGDSFFKITKTMRDNLDSSNLDNPYFNVGDIVLLMRIEKGKSYLLMDRIG